jgi:hypothetical protein
MILFLFNHPLQSQSRQGFEAFYYPGTPGILPSTSTKIYYQANNGWYTELRYNYEEEQAIACSAGKTFSKEKALSYSFTPIVGLVAGTLQGVSIGLNSFLAYKGITFSSSLQHASCFENKRTNFLFSWSELGCQVTKQISVGLVLQQTSIYNTGNDPEPGMQLSISLAKWTFPLYLFKAAGGPCYFVAGVSREWKQ